MGNKYLLILSNKWMYREIELSETNKTIQIGTQRGCTIRFSREFFFEDFVLLLENKNDSWIMSCAKTIFIKTVVIIVIYTETVKDITEFYRLSRKMYIKKLWLCFDGGLKNVYFRYGYQINSSLLCG